MRRGTSMKGEGRKVLIQQTQMEPTDDFLRQVHRFVRSNNYP